MKISNQKHVLLNLVVTALTVIIAVVIVLCSLRLVLDETVFGAIIGAVGAVFGALIGAIALIYTVKDAAKNVHLDFKNEKLAEAKRDIYLELVTQWQKYLHVSFEYKFIDKEDYLPNILKEMQELHTVLNKSSFVSPPIIKGEMVQWVYFITENFSELIPLVVEWYEAKEDEET